MKTGNRVFMVAHHHSDLVWRRTKKGYDRVREEQLLQVLDWMRRYPSFRFTIAQADIFKTFLRQHPELESEVKGLVADKRLETVGGIMSIPDTNMVSGESLVRNIQLGRRYYRETFGEEIKIAWFADAFGLNGQLPQILKKSGFSFLFPGRMPGLPAGEKHEKGFVWQGMDGSRIITARPRASLETMQYLCNVPVVYSVDERLSLTIENLQNLQGDNFAILCSEEGLFEESVFEKMESLNRQGKTVCGFALAEDYYRLLDPESLPEFHGEFNPTFTGCYTSRIKLKQLNRQAETLLAAAETACLAAHCTGKSRYPSKTFDRLWEKMALFQFHDAICGCHIDEVTGYLHALCKGVIRQSEKLIKESIAESVLSGISGQKGCVLFNPLPWGRKDVMAVGKTTGGIPCSGTGKCPDVQECGGSYYMPVDLPAMSRSFFKYRKGPVLTSKVLSDPKKLRKFCFETGYYRVSAEDNNLRIVPGFMKKSPLPAEFSGEIFFREDLGDLWTESFINPPLGRDFYSEVITRVLTGPVVSKVFIRGRVPIVNRDLGFYKLWDGVQHLSWEKEFIFFNGLKRFEMHLSLRWKGRNTLVGICFPTSVNPLDAEAVYSIPFGSVKRAPYYEVPLKYGETMSTLPADSHTATARGAWPALNWVDYSDGRSGLTIANTGTPGHQLNAGCIRVHLLRSLTKKTSGLQPGKLALENGTHRFSFAFLPHSGRVSAEGVRMAEEFNNPCRLADSGAPGNPDPARRSLISSGNPGVMLSACKLSDDGKKIVARFYEPLGKKTRTTVSFGVPVKKVYLSDLQEQPVSELQDLHLDFNPFEIKTVLAEM